MDEFIYENILFAMCLVWFDLAACCLGIRVKRYKVYCTTRPDGLKMTFHFIQLYTQLTMRSSIAILLRK